MGAKGKGRKKSNKSAGWILYCIVLYTIFTIVYAVMLWGTVKAYKESLGARNAYKGGHKVEAVVNDIESTSSKTSTGHYESSYYARYEYIDGDIVYSGRASADFRDYYKAEKYLGKSIDIYIDGKGGSIPVDGMPNFILPTILTVLDVVLFVPMFFWVRLGDWIAKVKEKRRKKIEEEKHLFFTWRKYD